MLRHIKRCSLSLLIASSVALLPALRADGGLGSDLTTNPLSSAPEPWPSDSGDSLATDPASVEESPDSVSPPEMDGSDDSEGAMVSQGSDDQKRAGKRKQLRNIGIALCAVAVAVVAMILVSTNDGHKSN